MSHPISQIWRIQQQDFLTWLRCGVAALSLSSGAAQDDDDIYICLPGKYGPALKQRTSVLTLIDELKAVSLHTPSATTEFSVRLRNLNEGWLPFRQITIDDPVQVQLLCLQVNPQADRAPTVAPSDTALTPSGTVIAEEDIPGEVASAQITDASHQVIPNSATTELQSREDSNLSPKSKGATLGRTSSSRNRRTQRKAAETDDDSQSPLFGVTQTPNAAPEMEQ